MTTKTQITAQTQAINAIHDVAVQLLSKSLPDDVRTQVELIVSISRYKLDVRSLAEVSPKA